MGIPYLKEATKDEDDKVASKLQSTMSQADSSSSSNQNVSLLSSRPWIICSLLMLNTIKTPKSDDPYSSIDSRSPGIAPPNMIINDDNQYQEFIGDENEPLQIEPGQSFPISADSVEAEQFENALPKIVEYLEKEKVPWQSVGCTGRVSEGPTTKIRSTVVISASTLERNPGDTSLPDLRVGVQKAGNFELPVEFVMGENSYDVTRKSMVSNYQGD